MSRSAWYAWGSGTLVSLVVATGGGVAQAAAPFPHLTLATAKAALPSASLLPAGVKRRTAATIKADAVRDWATKHGSRVVARERDDLGDVGQGLAGLARIHRWSGVSGGVPAT